MADQRYFVKMRRRVHAFIALLALAFAPAPGLTQLVAPVATNAIGAEPDLLVRHSPGSIQSVATANAVLAEAASARQGINVRFAENERACILKFFVNKCMEIAKESRRAALLTLRSLEVEANLFKRRERVAERDRAMDEARSKEAATPLIPGRARTEKMPSAALENTVPVAVRSVKKTEVTEPKMTPRQIEHDEKRKLRQSGGDDEARKRTAKIAAYEEKARKSETRQREIEVRRIERERQKQENSAKQADAKTK